MASIRFWYERTSALAGIQVLLFKSGNRSRSFLSDAVEVEDLRNEWKVGCA
jgi:hypothetical protein